MGGFGVAVAQLFSGGYDCVRFSSGSLVCFAFVGGLTRLRYAGGWWLLLVGGFGCLVIYAGVVFVDLYCGVAWVVVWVSGLICWWVRLVVLVLVCFGVLG